MAETDLAVRNDMVVALEFDLYLADGELFDTTEGDEPIMIIQGHGHIVPGLEEALYGMHIGEEKEVVIDPAQGYGEYDDEDMEWFPLDLFDAEIDLEPGVEVEVTDEDSDEVMVAYITEVGDDEVLLDFNHPLAGEQLRFRVKVVGIRPATDSELDHDHVHDMENGHH
ncbi:MAG: peptidylprolyl isomerase [Caldilineaceae bacterium]|nr:peptidylprolyl isomerase [Caldilineaceae bacterium]